MHRPGTHISMWIIIGSFGKDDLSLKLGPPCTEGSKMLFGYSGGPF